MKEQKFEFSAKNTFFTSDTHFGPTSSGLDCDRLVHLFPYQYDVGVDNNSYTPISWEEVKKKIQHQIDGRGTISYKVYKLND